MKKIIKVLSFCLAISILTSGCNVGKSKATTATNTDSAKQQTAQQSSQSTKDATNTNTNGDTSKKREFQRADLTGEVSEIVGNCVTLKVIKTPQFDPTQMKNGNRRNGANAQGNTQNTSQNNTNQSNQSAQSTQGRQRTVEYTGETKDITIPVGISITTMERSDTGMTTKDVAFKDIKKEDTLRIWYSQTNKQLITKISVTSKQSSSSSSQQGGGPQGGPPMF